MVQKKTLIIGGAIFVGIYLLNPYSGSFRGGAAEESHNPVSSSDMAGEQVQFSYQSERLKIVNFVGRLEYGPSPDDQIHIVATNILRGNVPHFDHIGVDLEVAGAEEIRQMSCGGISWASWGLLGWLFGSDITDEFDPNVSINNQTSYKLSEYPILQIQAPVTIDLTIENSVVFGNVETVRDLRLDATSCGDITVDEVKGNADIWMKGSGKIAIESVAGLSYFNIRGSGDINVGSLAQDSVLSIRGSGDMKVKQMTGIHKITIRGSGDIDIGHIKGDAEILVQGSGDVDIADGDMNWLIATVRGSGDIDYDGIAINRRLKVTGSGEIDTNYE